MGSGLRLIGGRKYFGLRRELGGNKEYRMLDREFNFSGWVRWVFTGLKSKSGIGLGYFDHFALSGNAAIGDSITVGSSQ